LTVAGYTDQSRNQIVIMIGTKAQLVKMAPVMLAMRSISCPYQLIYTGQHSETFSELEDSFGIGTADRNLVPHNESDTFHSVIGWTMRFWTAVFRRRNRRIWNRAQMVVVHGDTLSTLFGAVLGRMTGAKVAHIEAGLRSPRLFNPFPEEFIRRLVSHLSDLHFCPDEESVVNLRKVSGQKILTRGNTIVDCVRFAGQSERTGGEAIDRYCVTTIHRTENLANRSRFEQIMKRILEIPAIYGASVRFVLHPVTRSRLKQLKMFDQVSRSPGIHLVPRMEYTKFINLISDAEFLITDGGSNQEEAAILGIPTIILRDATERRDGLGTTAMLSDINAHEFHRAIESVLKMEQIRPENDDKSPSQIIAFAISKHVAEREEI